MITLHESMEFHWGVARGTINSGATASISTAGIDCQGAFEVVFIITTGAVTTNAVPTIKIEDSANNSTWADYGSTTTVIADDDDTQVFVHRVRCDRTDRYVRATITESGAQNCVIESMNAIVYGKDEPGTAAATTTVTNHDS